MVLRELLYSMGTDLWVRGARTAAWPTLDGITLAMALRQGRGAMSLIKGAAVCGGKTASILNFRDGERSPRKLHKSSARMRHSRSRSGSSSDWL